MKQKEIELKLRSAYFITDEQRKEFFTKIDFTLLSKIREVKHVGNRNLN